MCRSMQIFLGLLIWGLGFQAYGHEGHAKHNMVVFGENEIFASHIVYKVPHNFQVILKIQWDQEIEEQYFKEKKLHPADEFIFLLDHMDIRSISTVPFISGVLSRTDASGNKVELAPNVRVMRDHFQVIYFDELPLSLQ